MSKIISVSNQKGGVGKTTTALSLSAALGVLEKNVLLIDMDPQANASSGLGIDSNEINLSSYDLIIGKSDPKNLIIKSGSPNLDIVPAKIDLVGLEIEIVNESNREYLLKNSLDKIKNNYDFVIIDCPPSLGLITLNALTCSNSVIIPIQCEYFALEGLGKLLNTIKGVQKVHNSTLSLEGILLTMFDSRLRLSNQVKDDVKKHFGDVVFNTIIPRNVSLGEAPSYGESILVYNATSKGSKSYLKFAQEIINLNSDGEGV
ncbi:MAG: ParA family protein [Bacteroidota bacterium]|mgnify:FL=1|nr:ParA family protein [Bacteroidota bacterium]|tara:strand:+ start:814 stop:1593 length:780 start_codon:yes stop_codon:yes gene_type:complete